MIEYSIVRSKRKTVGIYILKDGSVEVRCPKNTKKDFIEKFIKEKESWITETSQKMKDLKCQRNKFDIKTGDELLFLGNSFSLKRSEDNRCYFDGRNFYAGKNSDCEQMKRDIVKLYKSLAKNVLSEKVKYYAKIMGADVAAVKISSAKTRWGSCSVKNSSNFSWRLILAPEEAVDYVVVHEIAHTFEHNHSKHFWAIVERFVSDYKACRKQLYSLQKKLEAEDWD